MNEIVAISLLGACSPALITAVAIMLMQPNPRKLMLGFLVGGYLSSFSVGLVVLFVMSQNATASTADTASELSPALSITIGLIALAVFLALRRDVDERVVTRWRERRQKDLEAEKEAGPSALEKRLAGGSPRLAFAAGAVVCLPGAPYFVLLSELQQLAVSRAEALLILIAVNIVLFVLIEVPLLAYLFFPEATDRTVRRFNTWVTTNLRSIVKYAALMVGLLFILKGVIDLLALS